MSHLSALLPDDRDWFDSLLDDEIDGLPSVKAPRIAASVFADVQALAAAGDEQASRAMVALARDGSYARARIAVKRHDRCSIKVSRSGRIVHLPARVGHRARKADGRIERFHQQTLWFELSWDQFEAWLDDRVRVRDHMSATIEAYREVLPLRSRHPDTRTPFEACEREGIDPRAFGLRDAA